jgi:hypothetical protein
MSSEDDEDDFDLTLEPEPMDIPGYLLEDGVIKAEGRRAFALVYVVDGEGVLLANWREEIAAVEQWLREGTLPLGDGTRGKVTAIRGGRNGP